VAVDVEAEDVAGVGIAAEHGADGVVGANAFEVEAAGVDEAAVDVGAGARVGIVAFCAGEDVEEVGFELEGGTDGELGCGEERGIGEELVG
jgi:hypothetical protein